MVHFASFLGNLVNSEANDEGLSTEPSQSIEFDPNDLDNILDQVENIDGMDTSSESQHGMHKEDINNQTDYQVVTGDEEIGPVFTTSSPSASPANNINNGVSQHAEELSNTASESYLIGSLTKNTEQPVDHRRQQQKDLGNVKSAYDAYNSEVNSYQRYNPKQQSTTDQARLTSDDSQPKNVSAFSTVYQTPEQCQTTTQNDFTANTKLSAEHSNSSVNTKLSDDHQKPESPMNMSASNVAKTNTFGQQYFAPPGNLSETNYQTNVKFCRQNSSGTDLPQAALQNDSVISGSRCTTVTCTSSPKSAYSMPTVASSHTSITSNYQTFSSVSPSSNDHHKPVPYHDPCVSRASTTLSTPLPLYPNAYNTTLPSDFNNAVASEYNATHTAERVATRTPHHNPSEHSVPPGPYDKGKDGSALAAWSPAKEAERWPMTSLSSSRHSANHSSVSQPYTSNSQHLSATPCSAINHVKESPNISKSAPSMQTFRGDPYQYTQFAAANNNPPSTEPTATNYPGVSASHLKQNVSQNETGQHLLHVNNTSQMLGRDSTIWSKVSQGTENVSPFDHSRSSSGHESLGSQHNDPHTYAHSKSATSQKANRNKSQAKDRRESTQSNHEFQNQSADGLQRPAEPSYSQPYNEMYGLHSNISQSSRSHISSSSIAVTSKSSVFSTESLLTKRKTSVERNKVQEMRSQSQLNDNSNSSHVDPRMLLQKDKSFMTNQPYSAPFNVNFFASTAQSAINSVTMSLSKHSSYTDPSFTFSLTSTSCPPLSANSYDKIPTSMSFQSQHGPRRGALHELDQASLPGTVAHSSITNIPSQQQSQSYGNQFGMNPGNPYHFKGANSHTANVVQPTPTAIKSKQAKSHITESAKDLSTTPYSFPSQPYGIPLASQTSEASATNLFNPQPIYNNPSASLGIPFQHHGFAGLPSRSAEFAAHAQQINPPARFNINNIFREKHPIDPFKLGGNNGGAGSVYPPPHSNLYANPMGILPGFDINCSALTATNPGLTGLRHPFDFNVPGQP